VRVAQMLGNLLGNACKYTPDGGAIGIAARVRDDAVEIRVTDSGIGIEPGKLDAIFELFAQADATLDRAAGGLGIGLALVRRLAALHGGSVRADSDGPGRGATFTLRLPRAAFSAPAPPPATG
jgi:signal transduction histidine kinase